MAKSLPRYDILLIPQNRSFTVVEQGTKAIINFLMTQGVARPTDEAVAKEWAEIYCQPGTTAHTAFTKGAFPGDYAPYLECTVRTGKKSVPIPFGADKGASVKLFIRFSGVLWDDLYGVFKNRLERMMQTRVDIIVQPHTELPPHVEVPEDELPDELRFARRDVEAPGVGTKVEEF